MNFFAVASTGAGILEQPQTASHTNNRSNELPLLPDCLSLLSHVALKVQDQFFVIGVSLGLDPGEISTIENESNNNCMKCFAQLFQKWEQRMTPSHTWDTIINILESDLVNRKDVAKELKNKLGK